MTDIVKRLQTENTMHGYYDSPAIQLEAAEEIEKLRAEIERLREALVLHSEVLAAHSGVLPEREWHQGNAWLYPGDRIVVAREPLPPIKVVEGKP